MQKKEKLAEAAAIQTAPARKIPAAIIQRDEILDAKTRIVGYRFAARLPESGALLKGQDAINLLAGYGIADFAQRRITVIPVSQDEWLANDYESLVTPNSIFLLEAPAEGAWETWRDVAALIRGRGAKVAVTINLLGQHLPGAADMVDYLVIDFTGYSVNNFEQALRTARNIAPTTGLIVENVARWAEFRYCISQGATYCLGPFTTEQDDTQDSQEIGQSRFVLIEMLNQLRREADLKEIAEIAKRDPGVVIKIIGMANSPIVGMSQPVTSIDQAIMILGREQLYRWLAIGMFRAGTASPRDEVLLELALARGRFLEILGQEKHSKLECDELFLLGLLSLLDCLLGIPMSTVVEKINLSPSMREVLLTSSGPLGRYLMLAIAMEKGHVGNVRRNAESLGFCLDAVEAASLEAIGWAEEAVQQTL